MQRLEQAGNATLTRLSALLIINPARFLASYTRYFPRLQCNCFF